MYHPYFRGKQYELITIRENAKRLAEAGFLPIIEPVRESLGGLEKALNAVCEVNGKAVVVVNPHYGDHAGSGVSISALLSNGFLDKPYIGAGVLLTNGMSVPDAMACFDAHKAHSRTLIHAGFTEGKDLADALGPDLVKARHVFIDEHSSKLYRRHFKDADRVLVKDGFQKRRNRDHPDVEFFSDLHITYADDGMNGFGDFLTVGDDYSETGGPAYAIAIHLTFIDHDADDAMFIYHFKSKRMDTPADPAGKFAEALEKLVKTVDAPGSKIYPTDAVLEFKELKRKGHFPGLGYVKKLSMQHHIETMARYFE
ncbi:sce7725 family protein [Xanthobacter variabilis]|uniref:sce7725 family protein n=1 Tax=Xanthobacter variabilis TaxID=3119932 RepID=UPI003727D860